MKTLYMIGALLLILFTPLTAQNTELQLLRNELFQADLDVKDAKASRWPTVELSITGSWMQNPPIGPITLSSDQLAPLVGFPPPPVPSYVTVYDGMEPTLYDFGLSLTQPLFTWGKINAAVKASEAVAAARYHQLENRKSEMEREIDTRLVVITQLRQIEQLLNLQQDLGRELISLMEQAVQSGLLLDLARAEAEIELQDIQLALLETQYTIKTQELDLQRLGEKPNARSREFDEQGIKELLELGLDTLLSFALHPERHALSALTSLEQASKEAVKIAKGSMYGKPDFALVVSLGYSGSRFPFLEKDWYGQNDYSLTLSVGMKTILFDGGATYNAVKRAESLTAVAELELRSAQEQIDSEVRKQYLLLSTLMEKRALQMQKIGTLDRRVAVNQTLFQSGYSSREQSIEAEMNLLATKIAYHQIAIEAEQSYQKLKHLCAL